VTTKIRGKRKEIPSSLIAPGSTASTQKQID
jgi:hypothetical protein